MNRGTFGTISLVMAPLCILLGALTYLTFEFVANPATNSVARENLPWITRVFVLSIIIILSTGVISGFVSILKNEKPRWRSIAGLFLTLVTVVTFHFLAVGPNGD